jgi:hypothetical protein
MGLVECVSDLDRNLYRVVDIEGPSFQSVGQGPSFEMLHHEVVCAVVVPDVIERADVRMIQRGERHGLAFESRDSIRLVRERGWQDLDGDITSQFAIARAIHLAHSAGTDERSDLIDAKLAADQRRGLVHEGVRRNRADRRSQKRVRALRVQEQRFHVPPQRLVAAARGCHERRAITCLTLQRCVAHLFDPLAAF